MVQDSVTEAAPNGEVRGQKAIWRLEQPIPAEIRDGLNGSSVMLAHLLWCRGFRTVEEIEDFFSGAVVMHDPYSLPDMAPAVERIARAVEGGERVAVYGDFDCDGITAAVALEETLRGCGLDPITYIPERGDGHGLHPEALAMLRDQGVQLVVTADCGISAIEEVRVALGMGMDVVVTDHHEPRADGSLPACPTVAPTRHDSEYPWRYLCGIGVAFKLAQALRRRLPDAPNPENLLDLVALGTIADVVSLRDENRSLVVWGLRRLRETRRPGLLALFEAASIERDKIDPVSVGFYLAPRINAANRMASPRMAYDLIAATDPTAARALARQLSEYNQQRQLLVAESFEQVAEQIGSPADLASQVAAGERPPLLMIIGAWPAGISGLLASKLVDAYGLPAFVGAQGEGGVVSVSARSVPGVHIDEILESCEAALPEGLFLGYGGHSGAGGFRVDGEKLELATQLLQEQACRQVKIDEIGSVLTVDAEVTLNQLTMHAAKQVRGLAPFGVGFPEPLFLSRGVTLERLLPLGGKGHARFSVQQRGSRIDGVWFKADPAFFELPAESTLDIVFHLQMDEWKGFFKPELRLRDYRLADTHLARPVAE